MNLPRRKSAGNTNHKVHSAPALGNLNDKALNVADFGQVGFGAPQFLFHRGGTACKFRPMFFRSVGHRHKGSVFGKIKRHGTSQRARSARDDSHSTVKVHKSSFLLASK